MTFSENYRKYLKESVRVYDDEKDYSTELNDVFNCIAKFTNTNFIHNNRDYVEYSYGTDRVDDNKVFDKLDEILANKGFLVSEDRVQHYAGIGNNNGYEIFKDNECIGYLNINHGFYGEVYVYLEDLNGNRINGAWTLRPTTGIARAVTFDKV